MTRSQEHKAPDEVGNNLMRSRRYHAGVRYPI